jgi:galacturan 1,4-alpha-galacturonidase
MTNAQNGARIKAFAGPNVGSGIIKNITFENFYETAVNHPVIIDQVRCAHYLINLFPDSFLFSIKCYETTATACAQFPSNTFIQDIWFTK